MQVGAGLMSSWPEKTPAPWQPGTGHKTSVHPDPARRAEILEELLVCLHGAGALPPFPEDKMLRSPAVASGGLLQNSPPSLVR